MSSIGKDVRYAMRGLRKQPGFTALATLTLALGIGSATLIFSVIQNVLLDPFPYPGADRVFVFQIRDLNSPRPGGRSWFQTAEFLDYQSQIAAFEEVIGDADEDVLLTADEGTERLHGVFVSGNTFRFLGVGAALGRVLAPDDATTGAPGVFVMSHRLWARRFGLDPGILGRRFVLNGSPTTLVGIMPPRFAKRGADVWLPAALDRADAAHSQRFYSLQARLKPGVTREQAEAQFQAVADRLAGVYPRNYPKKFAVRAVSWIDSVVGTFRTTLYTLAGAVTLLLLIACSNVANMLLVRASGRGKEMAIRVSLGAGRARLVRQLLIESLLLAVLGAGTGCLLAALGLEVLGRAIPEGLIPPETVIRLNLPALGFSLAAAVLTAIVFGLVPALHVASRGAAEPLKESGKGVTAGTTHGRLRGALVVAEVALSLVLLTAAGLLMRSFVKLQTIDLGVNVEHVLFVRLQIPPGQNRAADAKQQLFDQLLQRLGARPDVVAAAAVSALPLNGGIKTEVDLPAKSGAAQTTTLFHLCTDGYFRTVERRLLRGRLLSADDVRAARRVAVINDTLAARYFGEAEPLGRTIALKTLQALPAGAAVEDPIFEIVGVVADAKNVGIRNPVLPEAFIPSSLTRAFDRVILVRTVGPPLPLLATVRRDVWAVDRGLVLTDTGSLADYVRQFSYAEPRFALVVMGVFAGLGLLLVTIGVYSVIAYTVSRRTHEIGMRMALGATRGDVQRMVLRSTLALIGLGIVTGLVASLMTTRVLAAQLWDVNPRDPLTLGLVIVVVVAAGIAACVVPARRATRVDPIVALRCE